MHNLLITSVKPKASAWDRAEGDAPGEVSWEREDAAPWKDTTRVVFYHLGRKFRKSLVSCQEGCVSQGNL